MKHLLAPIHFCILLAFALYGRYSPAYELPSLGDSSSSIVSMREEYITGQNWLRSFRRQAPIAEDPLLYTYTADLVQDLAFHSQLTEKYFSLVMVDSPDFNAFAVPGNVIGINTGLFRYAETEDELAAVISHELAHLSQRHFARSVGAQKAQSIASLAALLGSLLIMASGNAESGMAALTATQAASISNQLRYSRTQEEEADRVGMQTMVNANKNPEAIAHMFEHMLAQTRYRTDIKEFAFLLTHPLTESRISDAISKARLLPKRHDSYTQNFHLMKTRAEFLATKNAYTSLKFFQEQQTNSPTPIANLYGMALSLLAIGKTEQATGIIDELYQQQPALPVFILLKADLLAQQQKLAEAELLLDRALERSPTNYPISMKAAKLALKNNNPNKGVSILRKLASSNKPDTPDVWYLLAELEGLSGNIAQVHLARAEYFVRVGALTQAQRHLYLALPLLDTDLQSKSRAQLRINEIEQIKQQEQF
jgi:predicted Zn-dependent protease